MIKQMSILAGLAIMSGPLMIGLAASAPATTDQATGGQLGKATFAGGCFWCMEPPFDKLAGVISTTVGYTGGHKDNPTYEEVSAGTTGHAEAIQIVFDPKKISYEALLDVFWRNVDPTVKDGQFCDRGHQYRTAIFYHDEAQRRLAEQSKKTLIESGRFTEVFTEITEASTFYVAEDYHQDYYKKNPVRYKFYRYSCGRDKRLKELWVKNQPIGENQSADL
jgi:peptide-methionine (S)-S-oxide reductase